MFDASKTSDFFLNKNKSLSLSFDKCFTIESFLFLYSLGISSSVELSIIELTVFLSLFGMVVNQKYRL